MLVYILANVLPIVFVHMDTRSCLYNALFVLGNYLHCKTYIQQWNELATKVLASLELVPLHYYHRLLVAPNVCHISCYYLTPTHTHIRTSKIWHDNNQWFNSIYSIGNLIGSFHFECVGVRTSSSAFDLLLNTIIITITIIANATQSTISLEIAIFSPAKWEDAWESAWVLLVATRFVDDKSYFTKLSLPIFTSLILKLESMWACAQMIFVDRIGLDHIQTNKVSWAANYVTWAWLRMSGKCNDNDKWRRKSVAPHDMTKWWRIGLELRRSLASFIGVQN